MKHLLRIVAIQVAAPTRASPIGSCRIGTRESTYDLREGNSDHLSLMLLQLNSFSTPAPTISGA
ncbi:MAG TPA: hypothetical protein PKE27_09570, partial [Povalibacter sp.]|uniref:hypothetical protein n=1 Tax=Povalibacter sp. TaxID=1962978 RepID=UPI002BDFC2E1